ncbi:MAG: hypothetical protein JNM27_16880 [Leptospirales bacterium]|nr:hypothetical protein [Leptospirales bacterium]
MRKMKNQMCFLAVVGLGLIVFNLSLPAETADLVDQIVVVGSETGSSDQCVRISLENSSKIPIGAMTFKVSFLDKAEEPFWSNIRVWSHDGKYSTNPESENGPFFPGTTRSFEVCGGPNMPVSEWDRPRVAVTFKSANRYIDLAKYDPICGRIKSCDKVKQSQMLLNQPQACQKMFAGLEASQLTLAMLPAINKCIESTPCEELDTFKCFSKAAQEGPPADPKPSPAARPESKIP